MKMDNRKLPWYLQTWFIAILFFFSFLYIPPIAGIVLLVMQYRENKQIEERYSTIDDANEYKQRIEMECQGQLDNARLDCQRQVSSANEKKIQIEMEVTALQGQKNSTETELQEIRNEINRLEDDVTFYAVKMPFVEENITSEEYKSKYNLIVLKEKEMVKSGSAVQVQNTARQKKEVNNAVKLILRAFNAETDSYISEITVKNIATVKNRIMKAFETLNKVCEIIGVSVTKEYLEIKLQESDLMYSYQYQKEQERLQQKAIREQMVEEEKVRREIEKEKAKIEKEESQFKNEIDNLMKRIRNATEIEQQLYLDKIRELQEKLKQVEESKKDVLNREQNTRAGFVYVISNIGSFGENVYKIGMTRRLDPMDRINELSSASVPFEFDVHAIIFSEDAPALETLLHNHFSNQRVNMVNKRKEFFRVSLKEIERFVKSSCNATVEFTRTASAEQYRETQRILKGE